MKFCQAHWGELKEAIKQRGLWHLVSKSGEEVTGKMIAQLKDDPESKDKLGSFDPLMAAHNMIVANALDAVGLSIMIGDQCPICALKVPEWIEKAADGVKDWYDEQTGGQA